MFSAFVKLDNVGLVLSREWTFLFFATKIHIIIPLYKYCVQCPLWSNNNNIAVNIVNIVQTVGDVSDRGNVLSKDCCLVSVW